MRTERVDCRTCGRNFIAKVGRNEYVRCRYCGADIRVNRGDFDIGGGGR